MTDNTPKGHKAHSTTETYLAVSPLLIRPWSEGRFSVYLRQDDHLVLYANRGEAFTPQLRERLFNMGVKEVYVPSWQKEEYEGYLEENLGMLLEDESIPMAERSGAMYAASMALVRDVFDQKLPKPLGQKGYERIRDLVRGGMKFFGNQNALKQMAKLISHDYEIYSHSVNVMVLTSFLLLTMEDQDQEKTARCAVGAMLHDFGKSRIPRTILDKRPDTLSAADQEALRSHPNLGVGMCAAAPLSPEAIHCILFHHEREDGSGYPSGLTGMDIPGYVKALSVCDVYDNLTSGAWSRQARTPFEALQYLEGRRGEFDTEMLKRLILVLANADILKK